jgi:hypothetical protein
LGGVRPPGPLELSRRASVSSSSRASRHPLDVSLRKAGRFLGMAIVVIVPLAACSADRQSPVADRTPAAGQSSSGSLCDTPSIAKPAWLPRDFPLPKGTRPVHGLARQNGAHRALFIVPIGLQALGRFVETKWTSAGYKVGSDGVQGSQLAGGFTKPKARGTFLAQAGCGKDRSILYLGYAST